MLRSHPFNLVRLFPVHSSCEPNVNDIFQTSNFFLLLSSRTFKRLQNVLRVCNFLSLFSIYFFSLFLIVCFYEIFFCKNLFWPTSKRVFQENRAVIGWSESRIWFENIFNESKDRVEIGFKSMERLTSFYFAIFIDWKNKKFFSFSWILDLI